MILLSILLLPLGITLLVAFTAWAERTLDQPTAEQSETATTDVAAGTSVVAR